MTDFMHLIGAEDVRSASHRMHDAALAMQSAAATIDEAVRRHSMALEDFMLRFEAAVDRLVSLTPKEKP